MRDLKDSSDREQLTERLAAALTERGLADAPALDRARRAASGTGDRFDAVLSRLGIVPERELAQTLALVLGLPFVDTAAMPAAAFLTDQLTRKFLQSKKLLPISATEDSLTLVMADPLNEDAVRSIAFLTGKTVHRSVCALGDFEAALLRLYGSTEGGAPGLQSGASDADGSTQADVERLKDIASEAPVVRFVNDVIARAVEERASDIHFEPGEDQLRIRFRQDGDLRDAESVAPSLRAAITSRIKIMARLDIAERRLPQDGRIKLAVRGREIDFRVSTMPTLFGESVVLRILDRSAVALDFGVLGFVEDTRARLEALLNRPNGILLVTGPTGSGKTTTLYAALKNLNRPNAKLFTVEDPIEYHLERVNQVQVHPKIGLSFSSTLRSILRQDPDIVMVGEVRDLETAEIAIQASLTGHLVLSTVHTNSAAATITRLIDMGVERYLLASTLTGVLAQRLVRRLCPSCANSQPLSAAEVAELKIAPSTLAGLGARAHDRLALGQPRGCDRCRGRGYLGRTAIMELLVMDDHIRNLILASAPEREIESAAVTAGMRTLYQDGLMRALGRETSMAEVLSATRISD